MGKICQDLITHLLSNREKSVKILTEESYSSSLVSWEKSVKSEQLCPPLHFPKSYCFLCVRQRKCMMRVLCMLYVRVYMSMFWECASVRVCVYVHVHAPDPHLGLLQDFRSLPRIFVCIPQYDDCLAR